MNAFFLTCSLQNDTSANKRSARISTALIPVWAEEKNEDNEKVLRRFYKTVITFYML